MKNNKIAIVGLGYWGKILLKNFSKSDFAVLFCCTKGKNENVSWLSNNHPNIKHTTDYDSLLKNPEISIIVIATPIKTHFFLAKKALLSKKNVFLEKPPSTSVAELEELISLSKENKKILFVDHVFSYNPLFTYLKQNIKEQKIKKIKTRWLKEGKSNENILWNLAYHDLYLISELIGGLKVESFVKNIDEDNKIDYQLTTNSGIKISLLISRGSLKNEKSIEIETNSKKYLWKNRQLLINGEVIRNEKLPVPIMINDFKESLEKNTIGINKKNAVDVVRLLELLTS